MPRTTTPSFSAEFRHVFAWADALGHALGQGVARGLKGAFQSLGGNGALGTVPGKRGRPAKRFLGVVAAHKRCHVAGCAKPARAKGLCSAHYQASRRKKMAQA